MTAEKENSQTVVAFVVQRYGDSVIGGAESHARLVVEHLAAARPELKIEVLTTCAQSYLSWRNHFAAGVTETTHANVTLRRFPVETPRSKWAFRLVNFFAKTFLPASLPKSLETWLERLWIKQQGPYCPDLLAWLRAHEACYVKVFFFSYLYYPTIYGIQALESSRSVLVPTAHDEPALYFPFAARTFAKVGCIFSNTAAESELIRSLDTSFSAKISQVGCGIESLNETSSLTEYECGRDRRTPYMLFLGRIGRGKGLDQLIEDYLCCLEKSLDRERFPQLWLAGHEEKKGLIPDHPMIKYLGFVTPDEKSALLREAHLVVNPSPKESLSLLILESLALGTPVLANAEASVHRLYAQELSCVIAYTDRNSFVASLQELASDDYKESKQKALAEARNWVENRFSWDRIVLKFMAEIRRANHSTSSQQPLGLDETSIERTQ